MKNPKQIIIIPARYHSSRLPGKPLIDCDGQSLLQRTYATASKVGDVWIATSDQCIVDHCRELGLSHVKTWDCVNGTQRVAAACELLQLLDTAVVINWQVDEPEVPIDDVSNLITAQHNNPGRIHTLVVPIPKNYKDTDPNSVKAICSKGRCHWFAREWIPGSYCHVGVYSFHRAMLRSLAKIEPTELSILHSLEQLTWIENRYVVSPVISQQRLAPLSINTEEDFEVYRIWLREMRLENVEQMQEEEL